MKSLIATLISIFAFSQIYAQDYASWQMVFEKSYAYEAEGNYQKSLEVLTSQYISDSYQFNIRYGWLYYNLGDYPKSKQYYKKSMELMPYSHEAKFGYVLPLAGLGEWDAIVAIYKSMLELDPKNTLILYRLGAIYYERKDFQTSYNYLEDVINLYPHDYDSNLLFAWTNLQMGRLKEASVLFRKVLLIRPGDDSAKEGLSLIQ
jgi:tetratricopeptide (TPR) repeat protein